MFASRWQKRTLKVGKEICKLYSQYDVIYDAIKDFMVMVSLEIMMLTSQW